MNALIPVKTLVLVVILTILGVIAFEQIEDRRPCHRTYGPYGPVHTLSPQELRQLIVQINGGKLYVTNKDLWTTVTSVTIQNEKGETVTRNNLALTSAGGEFFPFPEASENPFLSHIYSVQSAMGMTQGC